jgi:hypothetical protein
MITPFLQIMKSSFWRSRGGALGARAPGEAAAAAAAGLFAWRKDGGVPGSSRGEAAASPAGRQCRRQGEDLHGYSAPPVGIVGAAVLRGVSWIAGARDAASGAGIAAVGSGGRCWNAGVLWRRPAGMDVGGIASLQRQCLERFPDGTVPSIVRLIRGFFFGTWIRGRLPNFRAWRGETDVPTISPPLAI